MPVYQMHKPLVHTVEHDAGCPFSCQYDSYGYQQELNPGTLGEVRHLDH